MKPFVKSVHSLYGWGELDVAVFSIMRFVSLPGVIEIKLSKNVGGNVWLCIKTLNSDQGWITSLLVLPTCELVSACSNGFIRSFNLLNMDTKFSLLLGLSVLELTLVVVMLEMSETYVGKITFDYN